MPKILGSFWANSKVQIVWGKCSNWKINSKVYSKDLFVIIFSRKINKYENKQTGKTPKSGNLSSEFSEFIGESLLSILQKDPRRIAYVLQKLMGQQLTNTLRKYIWSDILLRHERKKIDSNVPVCSFTFFTLALRLFHNLYITSRDQSPRWLRSNWFYVF